MDTHTKPFPIIRFSADSRTYGPAYLADSYASSGVYVPYPEMDIPPGASRYGGPVMDLPPGVEPPEGLRFAAQLDLARFSAVDPTGLLPQTGHLIFFADIRSNAIQVIYANVPNDQLVRHISEHEDDFFAGALIDEIWAATETLQDRFHTPEEGEEDMFDLNEDGMFWDCFAGTDVSKLFGIYTNCQYDQDDIERIAFSDKVLLLQVGENGFNDEGVLSVLIPREDLKNLHFDRCECDWSQS